MAKDNGLLGVDDRVDDRADQGATLGQLYQAISSLMAPQQTTERPGVQLAGDVVPLQLNDPANFEQPERMPDTRVKQLDDADWAKRLFILPANDPGRRKPKAT